MTEWKKCINFPFFFYFSSSFEYKKEIFPVYPYTFLCIYIIRFFFLHYFHFQFLFTVYCVCVCRVGTHSRPGHNNMDGDEKWEKITITINVIPTRRSRRLPHITSIYVWSWCWWCTMVGMYTVVMVRWCVV